MTKAFQYKNKLFRKKLLLITIKEFSVKYLLLNKNMNEHLKFKIMLYYQKKKKKNFTTQINNVCIFTNYSRSVMRLSHFSKSSFKKLYAEGKMTGFRKGSW